jgi:hypothetical protein
MVRRTARRQRARPHTYATAALLEGNPLLCRSSSRTPPALHTQLTEAHPTPLVCTQRLIVLRSADPSTEQPPAANSDEELVRREQQLL